MGSPRLPRFRASERAFELIRRHEQSFAYFSDDEQKDTSPKLCSQCFEDFGLTLEATKFGEIYESPCPRCQSTHGKQLNTHERKKLAYRYYVLGSLQHFDYGCAPIIVFNEHQKTNIDVKNMLGNDLSIFEEVLGVGFFEYGPNLWMLGEVSPEPLVSLRKKRERPTIIGRILNEYPTATLLPEHLMFRVRINPDNPVNPAEYDTPPDTIKRDFGRFDSTDLPVLYGSFDIQTCVHECRTAVDDSIYLATLSPTKNLTVLDLSHQLEERVSPHESLDLTIHNLFKAGKYSYKITQELALAAKECGFDGIVFPSYFSSIRTGAPAFQTYMGMPLRYIPELREQMKNQLSQNIAIFGRPLSEQALNVVALTRVHLERAEYTLRYAPIIDTPK